MATVGQSRFKKDFLFLKKLTDKRVNGLPVLDIGVCPRFEIVWNKGVPDLEWLHRATFLEVMEILAR
ncbi:hypothetical protein ACFCVU_06415 [Peribacillus butanolivorans]|uniref:hypothetical protein n=1 Tax=Peribacillus butanolivorans TaxID=421767 RepID=UPI0035E2AC64